MGPFNFDITILWLQTDSEAATGEYLEMLLVKMIIARV